MNKIGIDFKTVQRELENSQGTEPTGKITITENGTDIDIAQYATADVNVSGGGSGASIKTDTVTTEQTQGATTLTEADFYDTNTTTDSKVCYMIVNADPELFSYDKVVLSCYDFSKTTSLGHDKYLAKFAGSDEGGTYTYFCEVIYDFKFDPVKKYIDSFSDIDGNDRLSEIISATIVSIDASPSNQ